MTSYIVHNYNTGKDKRMVEKSLSDLFIRLCKEKSETHCKIIDPRTGFGGTFDEFRLSNGKRVYRWYQNGPERGTYTISPKTGKKTAVPYWRM